MNKLIIEIDKLYFNEYLSDRWTNVNLEKEFEDGGDCFSDYICTVKLS